MSAHLLSAGGLANQDEAIDHYLSGLLTEVLPSEFTKKPLPFVRPQASPMMASEAETFADDVDEPAPLADQCIADEQICPDPNLDSSLSLEMPWQPPIRPQINPRVDDLLEQWTSQTESECPDAQCLDAHSVSEDELIAPALFAESTDREMEGAAIDRAMPAQQPDKPGESLAGIGAAVTPVAGEWQFFQLGALTVALPSASIHEVLSKPLLRSIRGQAPAAFAGVVQRAGRSLPIVSLRGLLPALTADEATVVLLGAQGSWGILLGQSVAPPVASVLDGIVWRQNGAQSPDRPWLAGINPKARVVMLAVSGVRQLLDAATNQGKGN